MYVRRCSAFLQHCNRCYWLLLVVSGRLPLTGIRRPLASRGARLRRAPLSRLRHGSRRERRDQTGSAAPLGVLRRAQTQPRRRPLRVNTGAHITWFHSTRTHARKHPPARLPAPPRPARSHAHTAQRARARVCVCVHVSRGTVVVRWFF